MKQNRPNLTVILLFLVLVLSGVGIYFFKTPISTHVYRSRLMGPDGEQRRRAAAAFAADDDFESFPYGFYAWCETADQETEKTVYGLFHRYTVPLSENEIFLFYEEIGKDVPRDSDYMDRLARAANDEDSPSRRSRALFGAYIMRHPDRGEFLEAAVSDGSPLVRYKAALLLGRYGDEGDLSRLLDLLGDEKREIRFKAAEGIREKWMKPACRRLVADLMHLEPEIRRSAYEKLRVLTEKDVPYDWAAPEEERIRAAREWKKKLGLD